MYIGHLQLFSESDVVHFTVLLHHQWSLGGIDDHHFILMASAQLHFLYIWASTNSVVQSSCGLGNNNCLYGQHIIISTMQPKTLV